MLSDDAVTKCISKMRKFQKNSRFIRFKEGGFDADIFVSKLDSLCRMTLEREMAALGAIDKLQQEEDAEYEVIPL